MFSAKARKVILLLLRSWMSLMAQTGATRIQWLFITDGHKRQRKKGRVVLQHTAKDKDFLFIKFSKIKLFVKNKNVDLEMWLRLKTVVSVILIKGVTLQYFTQLKKRDTILLAVIRISLNAFFFFFFFTNI